jgi:TRAP-type mannitol/chloroaromatic compound transport system, periplasmic component
VISAKADEVVMLKDFGQTVTDLTGGSVKFEILPAGTVVGVKETLDAVDKGLIDCGFAWTHYWSGEHPAAMLFGSPVAGAGVGLDNIAFLSWFQYGGGKELYNQLWKEMKRDVHGLMLQPVGPEALGWFKEPIKNMADFRKLDLEHLQEFLVKRTKTSELLQLQWVEEIFFQHYKKEQSMLRSGAVLNQTVFLDFKKFLNITTYKVFTKLS